jgi:hypothetical protein
MGVRVKHNTEQPGAQKRIPAHSIGWEYYSLSNRTNARRTPQASAAHQARVQGHISVKTCARCTMLRIQAATPRQPLQSPTQTILRVYASKHLPKAPPNITIRCGQVKTLTEDKIITNVTRIPNPASSASTPPSRKHRNGTIKPERTLTN